MKALITGAAGLVGRGAVAAFRARGWDVVGVTRGAVDPSLDIPWITGDLAAEPLPSESFEGVDAVVHLAAIPGPGAVPDAALFRNNVCGTFNVLDAAARAGVRRAVVASSISIYGIVWADQEVAPPEIPLSENSPLLVADAYALSKETDEATARMIARRYGMSIASLRLPNISSAEFVVERAATVARDPQEAHRELWAYLTVEDAGTAIVQASIADFQGAVVANCVSPDSLAGDGLAEAARHFYPELDVAEIACGYTTAVARDTFQFEGRVIARPI